MRTQELVHPRLLKSVLDSLTGTLLCPWLALTAALLAQTRSYPLGLLLLFVPVVGLVARVWGFAAAMLGLASAVSVLRVALFVPVGRMDIASVDARTGLFWMVLGAGVAAYVFARPQRASTEIREGGKSC